MTTEELMEARDALRELLDQLRSTPDFGPAVSEEFQRGYAAGRSDSVALVDVSVTEILIGEGLEAADVEGGRPRGDLRVQ
jgi:hypothetical protein